MINEFNTNPNVKVFIGNIIAAGVGISLTISKSLIFNTFSYVSGENKQAEDRIHRLNSTRDVDIYYQIFNNTQYQHMWDIVLKKQLICDTVIKKESEK
jgi:SWI/SNF-related matrix-associated actin-dependent regulator 1 of chromatin subfamily A